MRTLIVNILLSIIAYNMFLMTNKLLVDGYNCIYITSNQLLSAYCRHSDFIDVPQDFDPKIQGLIFENDTFRQMDEKSFVVYVNLTSIRIHRVAYRYKKNPIHEKTFQNLTKLETLSMENIFTEFEPSSLIYPPNLKNISFSQNDFIEEVDLRTAPSLTEFYAFDCSLRSFPQFNKSAPLVTLDVRWNPMDNWTAEDLAPFCLLQRIHIEWNDESRLPEPDRYCQCVRLENWIKLYGIVTLYSLNCTPPADAKTPRCNIEYSEDTLNQRRECLAKYSPPTDKAWDFIFATSILTVLASTLGYRVMQLTSAERTHLRRKRDVKFTTQRKTRSGGKHKQQKTTKAPEKTERGGDAEFESEKESTAHEEKVEEEYILEEEEFWDGGDVDEIDE